MAAHPSQDRHHDRGHPVGARRRAEVVAANRHRQFGRRLLGDSLIADRALDRLANAEMLVPTLFWYELANVLVVNERRGRIDRERSAVALEKIRTLQFHTDDAGTEISSTIDFARTYALTVYDACYLELAARAGAVLATLDLRLQAAAVSEGVALVTEA